MDGAWFDEVARHWVADPASRRAALRLTLGALLGAVLSRRQLGAATTCGLVGTACTGRRSTECCPGSVCRKTPEGTFACRCRYRRTECDSKCWVLPTSETHCGQCGNPCAAGQRCCGGACYDACPSGLFFNEATCGCTACRSDGARCGRTGAPPCCSGRCERKRGTHKRICRQA